MTLSLSDKVRAGRRAALVSLNARFAHGVNVVSIFEGSYPRRQTVPLFCSVRSGRIAPAADLPILLLTNRVAA